MRNILVLTLVFAAIGGADLFGQRRGTRATATFAVVVTDPDGTPVPNVLVTLQGPASRSARTEGGRIAFEGLPPGTYTFRFEREGFVTLEKELTAKGGPPIDVKVTLVPVPAPVVPPAPPPPPTIDAKPTAIDLPGFIEKNYIGRGATRTLPLACATDTAATLLQVNGTLADQVHADADEFLYVVAGEGAVKMAARQDQLQAGMLVLVPRGVSHTLTARGKGPLVVLATRGGEGCK